VQANLKTAEIQEQLLAKGWTGLRSGDDCLPGDRTSDDVTSKVMPVQSRRKPRAAVHALPAGHRMETEDSAREPTPDGDEVSPATGIDRGATRISRAMARLSMATTSAHPAPRGQPDLGQVMLVHGCAALVQSPTNTVAPVPSILDGQAVMSSWGILQAELKSSTRHARTCQALRQHLTGRAAQHERLSPQPDIGKQSHRSCRAECCQKCRRICAAHLRMTAQRRRLTHQSIALCLLAHAVLHQRKSSGKMWTRRRQTSRCSSLRFSVSKARAPMHAQIKAWQELLQMHNLRRHQEVQQRPQQHHLVYQLPAQSTQVQQAGRSRASAA
jgi:hypothetical protein